ncbi:MAG: alkaline phosphatase [Chitinophagales bacterium]|nr:alkaline phosphatase [Chitinophagales bacterium]
MSCKLIVGTISVLLFISCNTSNPPNKDVTTTTPKNLILLIGDGMGLSHVSSAFYFQDKEPNFKRFKTIGLMNTSAKDMKITDSASSATAMACGKKTNNRSISVDENDESLETLIERVSKNDIASGLVVTSSITHATPAAFYAHVPDRSMEEEIAEQLLSSSVDFAAGGGLRFFTDRKDSKDLLSSFEEKGFVVTTDPEKSVDASKKQLYLLANDGMPSKLNGRDDFLIDYTKIAMDHLSKHENGFFLMVEGSQIDWAAHDASPEGVVLETIDFDRAIGEALNFAEKDGNTLVVVTADHETGGYAIIPEDDGEGWNYENITGGFYQDATKYGSTTHTATLVPVFAFGPGAVNLSGIYDIDRIFHKIVESMNW